MNQAANKPSAPLTHGAPHSSASRVRTVIIGWILIPIACIAAIFAVGVHCGAAAPEQAPARWVLWAHDAVFGDLPPSPPEKKD
jgi:hypothetical protein